MKVLVIDDDESIVTMLSTALGLFDYEVTTASDGQEGLEQYLENPGSIDLIISDIKMPRLDGIQLAERLAAGGYATPVILITGHSTITDNPSINCIDVLYKPFAMEQLFALLERAEKEIREIK